MQLTFDKVTYLSYRYVSVSLLVKYNSNVYGYPYLHFSNRPNQHLPVWPGAMFCHNITPGHKSQRKGYTGPTRQEKQTQTQEKSEEGRQEGTEMKAAEFPINPNHYVNTN